MKPLVASLVLLVSSCHPTPRTDAPARLVPGTYVITAEQIERSGAHSAWEALKSDAPMLLMEEDRNGAPARLTRRGRSSFMLDDAPMVLVDGVRLSDFRVLANIEAASITSITIYEGVEGTTYYGTGAVSGVIAIKTKDGRPS